MPRCSPDRRLVLLALAARARCATTGWISNSGTSSGDSIVVSHSDENLACANDAWKAADGIPGFGCPAATGCPAVQCPIAGWNAGAGSEWLVFDFKRTLSLSALRFSGAGDTLHDPKDMQLFAGDTVTGPWRAVGTPLVGAAGTHGANTFNEVWQEFGFPTTSSRFWKWEIASRHGGYQAWVGEVEFYGTSNWGWTVIVLMLGVTALYLGVGTARNIRRFGLTGSAALPHRAFWLEGAALVADGVHFSRSVLRTGVRRSHAARPARESPLMIGKARSAMDVDERRTKRGSKRKEGKIKAKSKSKVRKENDVRASRGASSSLPATQPNLENDPGTHVREQHIVAENLHQSQAKIAVVGLNEM